MEKPWLQSYETGVAHEIDITRYQSIIDVFQKSVAKFGDKPAFQNMGKSLSYNETAKLATEFACLFCKTY